MKVYLVHKSLSCDYLYERNKVVAKFRGMLDLYHFDKPKAAYLFADITKFCVNLGCTKSALSHLSIGISEHFCNAPRIAWSDSDKSSNKTLFSYGKRVLSD